MRKEIKASNPLCSLEQPDASGIYTVFFAGRNCSCCGTEIYMAIQKRKSPKQSGRTYSETTYSMMERFFELESKEFYDRACPTCRARFADTPEHTRSLLQEVDGKVLERDLKGYVSTNIEQLFAEMSAARRELNEKKSTAQVAAFIETCNASTPVINVATANAENIKSNKTALENYIAHLLKIESGIYSTTQLLSSLYRTKQELEIEFIPKAKKATTTAKRELTKAEKSLRELCNDVDPTANVYLKQPFCGNPPHFPRESEPVAPQKPNCPKERPKEPEYEVPGLLNKKKVLAKNSQLKATYEKELEHYEKACEELRLYELACTEYEKRREEHEEKIYQYSIDLEAYEQKCSQLKAAALAEYEADKATAIASHKEKIVEAEKEVSKRRAALEFVSNLSVTSDDSYIFVNEEVKKAENLISEMVACRNELYSQNVIYPKYRNMVAIASFNDYLLSGRCSTLEGSDGAYNLYEAECRADLVISKLSDVVISLEQIRDNQYMLYQQMVEVNSGLARLNSSMERAIASLKEIEANTEYLHTISENTEKLNAKTDAISKNMNVIAYNTEVTAFYTRKSAELTNALGFMVALK